MLEALDTVKMKPQIVTLTIGGNDFLQGLMYVHAKATSVDGVVAHILKNVDRICDRQCPRGNAILACLTTELRL